MENVKRSKKRRHRHCKAKLEYEEKRRKWKIEGKREVKHEIVFEIEIRNIRCIWLVIGAFSSFTLECN